MFNYSIIIPHYNIPHLLKRCLVSIPERGDTQVIVVDDCSNEKEQALLKELERQFPYVQFVYLATNQGGGHARNVGLQYAEGRYVIFADADDFFHDNLNDILHDYRNETCDVVFFNANSVDSTTGKPTHRANLLQSQINRYVNGLDPEAMQLRYLFPEPWCKIVRREFSRANDIKFDETKVINDQTFSYMLGYHAQHVRVDSRIVYCVTYRPESITFTDTFKRDTIWVEVIARKNSFMKKHHIPIFDMEMLVPFRKHIKRGDWQKSEKLFKMAKNYGFTKRFILFQLAQNAVICRMRFFFNKG